MFDPTTIGLALAIWFGFRKQANTQYGILTPEREEVYRNALEFLKDPMKLNELAEHYQREGLKVQAVMLKKRAEWRGRSSTVKAQHEHIYNQAMASTNVNAIIACAEAFEKMTATVKAQQLRSRAKAVYEENEAKARNTVDDSAPVHAPPEESSVKVKTPSNGAAKAESIPRNTEADIQTEIS